MAAIKPYTIIFCTLFMVLALCFSSFARTSLVTLPERSSTTVRLNDDRLTLVQEKRILSLKKGLNQINFSWQNVYIQQDSIQLTTPGHENDITVLSVSFPPNESALVWNVYSKDRIELEVMISYLLSGIDGLSAYHALADTDETRVAFKTFMILRNFSGENFNAADFTLNGSEKFKTPVSHQETKRILIDRQDRIPIQKTAVWDAAVMPHDPALLHQAVGIPVFYEINNKTKSGLGIRPVFKGKTRLYQTDPSGSTIFSGEDQTPYTPVGDAFKVKIGETRDIVVTRRILDTKRINLEKNKNGKIQVYDKIVNLQLEIENMKNKPSRLEIIETIDGEWEPIEFSAEWERLDHQKIKFSLTLAPNEKKTLKLNYKLLNVFTGSFSRFNTLPD